MLLLEKLVKTQAVSRGRGYLEDPAIAYPAAICRLRKSIDEALGKQSGKEIVETGVGAEYRLAPIVQVASEREEKTRQPVGGRGTSNRERLSAA